MAFNYDSDGFRVGSVLGAEETRYLIDTNRPLAEVLEKYTPSGGLLVSYVHGADLISEHRNGVPSYYHMVRGL